MAAKYRVGYERRRFLGAATCGASLLAAGCASNARVARGQEKPEAKHEEEVSPGEDLMREHGVLERISWRSMRGSSAL